MKFCFYPTRRFSPAVLILFFVMALSFPLKVNAADFFLAPMGSDATGNGTESSPWFSLEKAFTGIQPGDTIYLKGGTYKPTQKDQFWVKEKKGTENALITIKNLGNEVPVITAESASYGSSEGVVTFVDTAYILFSGITVDGSHSQTGKQMRGVFVQNDSHHITLDNLIIKNTHQKGVGLSGQYITLQNSEVTNTSRDNYQANLDKSDGSGWQQAVSTYLGADEIIIKNNYIHENWGEGIDVILGKNVLIDSNILHDNYSANIYVDTGYNVTIQGNIVYRTKAEFDRQKSDNSIDRANSILLANELSDSAFFLNNIVIKDNILGLGNKRGVGYFQMEGRYKNVSINNNVVYNPTQEFLWMDAASGNLGVNSLTQNSFVTTANLSSDPISIDSQTDSWSFSGNGWFPSNLVVANYSKSSTDFTPNLQFDVAGIQNHNVTKSYSLSQFSPYLTGYTNLPSPTPTPSPSPSPTPTPTPSPTPDPTTPSCTRTADINTDGAVNLLDYTLLSSNFFSEEANISSDIDCSGRVDLKDYTQLVHGFSL